MERKTLFFILNYGSSIRNMVGSGVLQGLFTQGYRIVFLAVNERDRKAIKELFPDQALFDDLGPLPEEGPYFMLQRLRTFVWRTRIRYRELLASRGKSKTPTHYLQDLLGWLLRPVPYRLWAWLNGHLAHWPRGEELLERYHPVGVVISNPISVENQIIDYCRQRGLYTACVLESWDNLTNRGALYSFPLDLVVWNELIKKQAIRFHRIPEEHIFVTGIPSFDLYHHPERYPDEAEWRRENGLPATGPVILYSLSSKHIHDAEDMVIRHLVSARARGELPADTHFLVRFHPKDWNEVMDKYQGLEGVYLQLPLKTFAERVNDPTFGGSPMMLAATVRYASVLVNVFSTMCLDALCNGTPVVVVNFDFGEKDIYRSVRRYLSFEHIRDLLSFDAVLVANDADEMTRHVAACLADREIKRANRERCVAVETFGLDGHAASRTRGILDGRINAFRAGRG